LHVPLLIKYLGIAVANLADREQRAGALGPHGNRENIQ
jgi:hypothetical protein